MKPEFNIGARNGLLEQKHFDSLGNAIWLYLWFLDKQPKDTDKVLGGRPITYQMFAEKFPKVPRQTYIRWLALIKKGGYVDLLRTPVGYVVTINKPKKWVKSDVSKSVHQSQKKANSDVSKMGSDVSKSVHLMPKNDTSNIKETVNNTIIYSTTTNVVADDASEIGVLYYKIIKKLKLPVRNHNNVKSTIKKMQLEQQDKANINYLRFMLEQFEHAEFEFKPNVNEALDIYAKRNQIINNIKLAQRGSSNVEVIS